MNTNLPDLVEVSEEDSESGNLAQVADSIFSDSSNEDEESKEFQDASVGDDGKSNDSNSTELKDDIEPSVQRTEETNAKKTKPDEPQSLTSVRKRKRVPVNDSPPLTIEQSADKMSRDGMLWVQKRARNVALALTFAVTLLFCVLFIYASSDEQPEKHSLFIDDTIEGEKRILLAVGPEEQAVEEFCLGYALMRDVCEIIAKEEGWHRTRPDSYNPLSPLSALPEHPYFCINNLLSVYAGGDTLNMRRRQEKKWATIKHIQTHMPGDAVDLAEQVLEVISITQNDMDPNGERISHIDDLSHADISVLGYLHDALIFRDLGMLTQKKAKARLSLMKYSRLLELAASLSDEQQHSKNADTSYCVCGPHMNIARSIVLTITPHARRLFVEPKIEKHSKDPWPFSPDDLPWRKHYVHGTGPIGDTLWATDTALLNALNMRDAVSRYSDELTVESIRMRLETDGEPSLVSEEGRIVTRESGVEAMCIQYCHQMAFSLMDTVSTVVTEAERLSI